MSNETTTTPDFTVMSERAIVKYKEQFPEEYAMAFEKNKEETTKVLEEVKDRIGALLADYPQVSILGVFTIPSPHFSAIGKYRHTPNDSDDNYITDQHASRISQSLREMADKIDPNSPKTPDSLRGLFN